VSRFVRGSGVESDIVINPIGPASTTAARVLTLRRLHEKAHEDSEQRKISYMAWQELSRNLKDEDVDQADGKAVATLLTSWAYFAKSWERGKDGPRADDPLLPSEEEHRAFMEKAMRSQPETTATRFKKKH